MSNFSIPGGQGVAKGSFLVNVTPTGAANIDDFSFNSDDVPSAVAVDPMGNLWIAGIANSDDIVTTPGAFQTNFGGNSDGFLIELDPSGVFTLYSTYLGGSSGDGIEGLAIDSFGNPYLTGFTQSSDFPSTTGVFQPNLAGAGGNAFVARIVASPKLSPTLTPTVTGTPTVTPTVVPITPTATATPSATITRTALPTRVPPTSTASIAVTPIASPFSPPTSTATQTATPTMTPTITATPTATPTPIGALNLSPAAGINFGRIKVGQTSGVRFVEVANKNKGSAMPAAIELRSMVLGYVSGFVIDEVKSTCKVGAAIARGKSCKVAITFTPPGLGAYADNVLLTGNLTNSGQPVGLSGTGK